jgi:phytol kinase
VATCTIQPPWHTFFSFVVTALRMPLEPLHQNILAAAATVIYAKSVIGMCEFAVSRSLLPLKISRKIIHMTAGSWLAFWPLFSEEHPSWRLNVLIPVVYSVQLFVKGVFLKDRNDIDVKTMTRTGDPAELLNGPLVFLLVMATIGIYCFRAKESVFIMACLGFGDGIAPLTGSYFPFGSYPTYPFGHNDKKTLSGSLGFFVGSIIGYYFLRIASPECPLDFETICQVAAICAVTEGITGKYDNLFVALTAYAASKYLL